MIGFVDTNAALRYLWDDEPAESPPARQLIEESPPESLYLSEVVVAEVVWTMHRGYERTEIVVMLQKLLANESLIFEPVMWATVANYSASRLDFADCLLAARSQATGLPVISYDRGYKRFEDVVARTPAEQLAVRRA